jgi:hypothetical protein
MDFTVSIYLKRMFAAQHSVNNAYTEFHENNMNISVTDAQSQTKRRRVSSHMRVGLKVSDLTYKSRAKWKMLRGIYSAIYGEVNVSV